MLKLSRIPCRHFILCKMANIFIHADILVLVSEFVVVNLSEWWLVSTTADHCGHIPENVMCMYTLITRHSYDVYTCNNHNTSIAS